MSKPGLWTLSGLCVGRDREFSSADSQAINSAKRICTRCPVLNECQTYALANDVDGVCGGLSAKERHDLAQCKIAS